MFYIPHNHTFVFFILKQDEKPKPRTNIIKKIEELYFSKVKLSKGSINSKRLRRNKKIRTDND